ncbi:MAG TPA: S8 family serine peptidase [Frankiaceae bacterium]|nr:S8 family serine peptidase [Frankiaceae bacterium]
MRARPLLAAIPAAILSLSLTPAQAAPVATAPYVVTVRDGVSSTDAAAFARGIGAEVTDVWSLAINGFAARLTLAEVAALRANPAIQLVEHDAVFGIAATQTNLPNWGLDRVDQRSLPLSGSYTYTATGTGVKVYIVDSGIRFSHTQFGGRAISGTDAIDGGTADDCNGHGTHVAGIAGGSTVGGAKTASIIAVRVLNCSGTGTLSQIVNGLNWTIADHAAGTPAVANMSLGAGANSTIDTAVNNTINDGITVVVAAGNGNTGGVRQPACNYSPARVANAITVGATTKTDAAASFSNYGSCVDWLAPGVEILSSWHTGDTAGAYVDGTSQAAPHVAGIAAQYLQGNPTASPATVRSALYTLTTKNVISNVGTGTPNALAYTNL